MSEPANQSARASVLIVEDSSVFREMQSLLIRQAGYAISAHEHPHAALDAAKARPYDLVVIDYELPAMNGEQFMHALRKILPDIAVVFVSGSLTLELAIKLTNQGVAGVFHKPVNPKILLEKINEVLTNKGARGSNSPLPAARRANSNSPVPALASEPADGDLAYSPRYFGGRSAAFRDFTHRLWRVRDFRSVLLLQGDAGSPFELIARDLAEISIFRDGPVMLCDAAQFEPRHLIEVLAPTLLATDSGTLIVTGVEQFTADQQKVLGSLMTGRDVFLPFARRFRLVLAAAGNFGELADDGRFDETLYYKISSLALTIPPLRELLEDLPTHVEALLAEHRITLNATSPLVLADGAMDWLAAQAWPGNYAQLSRTLLAAAKAAAGAPAIAVAAIESAYQAELNANHLPAPAPARQETRAPAAPATPVAAPAAPAPAPATNGSVAPKITPRPVTIGYDFSQRLAAALAAAQAVSAI